MVSQESILQEQVCGYLRVRYPDVIFRSDFAAGIKMTIGQAKRHKRLQYSRAYPDLFIAEARHGHHGLFIELKVVNIYKRDGTLISNEHIREQATMLSRLRAKGYKAEFAIGFREAQQMIDDYMAAPLR